MSLLGLDLDVLCLRSGDGAAMSPEIRILTRGILQGQGVSGLEPPFECRQRAGPKHSQSGMQYLSCIETCPPLCQVLRVASACSTA